MLVNGSPDLTSADAVFDALGGVPGVMQITGARYKTVHAWKRAKSFPSDTYVSMALELQKRGLSAGPELWDMRLPNGGQQ